MVDIHPDHGQRINGGAELKSKASRTTRNLEWDATPSSRTVIINPNSKKLELWSEITRTHFVINSPIAIDLDLDRDSDLGPLEDEQRIVALVNYADPNIPPLIKTVDASRYPNGIIYPPNYNAYIFLTNIQAYGTEGEYRAGILFKDDAGAGFVRTGTGNIGYNSVHRKVEGSQWINVNWELDPESPLLTEPLEIAGVDIGGALFTVHHDPTGNTRAGFFRARLTDLGYLYTKFQAGVELHFSMQAQRMRGE